jgi:adenylyltransferase/sulfurtransferase
MLTDNSENSKILTAPELRRFKHQINLKDIGLHGQEKIKVSKVVVVGAGGIGAQVLQFLAATGIGNLVIIDDQLVTEESIQIQTLYGGNDLGKLKTIISRQRLQNLYPLTGFDILNLRITSQNAENFLSDCDIVVDASNTVETHYIVNDICKRNKKPWIYGHTAGTSAELTVFNYMNGPDYRTLYPDDNDTKHDDSPAFVFGALGCLMAAECIKTLLKSKDVLSGRVLNFDLFSNIFVQQNIAKQ